jgi:hypothetical protein
VAQFQATNQKDAGSIPDSVTGIFLGHNPFDLTMALGSAQLLTIPRIFPVVKAADA